MSDEKDPLSCRQKDCDNPAVFRYTWPGKDESYCCIICGMKLEGIANAIGHRQQFIRLETSDYSKMMEKTDAAKSGASE